MELFEKAREARISAGRRTPAHVCDLDVLSRKIRGEYLKADIDHPRRGGKQISRKIALILSPERTVAFPATLFNTWLSRSGR